jgi:flavin-dependent dehydrogenase
VELVRLAARDRTDAIRICASITAITSDAPSSTNCCSTIGATVIEGTRVTEVEFGTDGRSKVIAVGSNGEPSVWFSRFLVDASGRDTLLLRRLGLKRVDKRNNTAAVFGHFRNVPRQNGSAEGMITMHLFQHGWFWMIPLPDQVMSVGIVGTRSFFRTRTEDLGSFFARADQRVA